MIGDMVDLKMKPGSEEPGVEMGESPYPYGTSLCIKDDLIEELGASSLKVGDIVEVRAFAVVERTAEYDDGEGPEKSVDLQLTSMKLSKGKEDRIEQMYGE